MVDPILPEYWVIGEPDDHFAPSGFWAPLVDSNENQKL